MAFLPALAAVASLASAAVGAAGTISAGIYQKQVADNNAKIARMAAADEEMRGVQEAALQDQKTSAKMAEQRAGQSASGIDIGEGSPLAIRESTEDLAKLDRKTTVENAGKRAWGLRNQAANMEAEGKAGLAASYMEGTSTLLAGASSFGSKWNSFKTSGIF